MTRPERCSHLRSPAAMNWSIMIFLQLCDDHPFHYPSPEKQARQIQDCNMQVRVLGRSRAGAT
jgi:hypothetical protein